MDLRHVFIVFYGYLEQILYLAIFYNCSIFCSFYFFRINIFFQELRIFGKFCYLNTKMIKAVFRLEFVIRSWIKGLTHFKPLVFFYITWIHQKFSIISGGYRKRPVVWNRLEARGVINSLTLYFAVS